MLFFDIPLILLGAVLLSYGYFIFFKKRHELINGYEKNYSRFTEGYAARLGLIEFICGILCILLGAAGIFIGSRYYSAAVFFAAPLAAVAALSINNLRSLRK